MNKKNAIILTVGTGASEKTRSTLLVPMAKSIREQTWDRVVLIPSMETARLAKELAAMLPEQDVTIRPLSTQEVEFNIDKCFMEMHSIVRSVRQEGFSPITVDFTRGTKVMSASLILAASANGVEHLHYISASQSKRDSRGNVRAGEEEVVSMVPIVSNLRRVLDHSSQFIRNATSALAMELLPVPGSRDFRETVPECWKDEATALYQRAAGLAEWDRFAYAAALPFLEASNTYSRQSYVSPGTLDHLKILSKPPKKRCSPEHNMYIRHLASDILQNAYRRILHNQLEDALLRAYRVRELICHARLINHNVDPANPDMKIPEIKEVLKSYPRRPRRQNIKIHECCEILKCFMDPLGIDLMDDTLFTDEGGLSVGTRNASLLAHGLTAQSSKKITATCDKLKELLIREYSECRDFLQAAVFPKA